MMKYSQYTPLKLRPNDVLQISLLLLLLISMTNLLIARTRMMFLFLKFILLYMRFLLHA